MLIGRLASGLTAAVHAVNVLAVAHHKRHRPKSTRAGCLLCKPHKRQGCAKHPRSKRAQAVLAEPIAGLLVN